MKHFIVPSLAFLAFSGITLAQTDRDLDSHEHGFALLNIALEDSSVYIEMESPWDNLIGFEHEPKNDEQQAQLDAALAMLNKPEELFAFAGSSCSVIQTSVESSLGSAEDHHDDEHGEDEEHAAHDDELAHDEEESETHSEVVAMYAFLCEDIGKLSSMDVKLFQQWQGIEDVDVQLAGPGGQSAIELNADSARIDLSSVN